jgi:hypothetical protein
MLARTALLVLEIVGRLVPVRLAGALVLRRYAVSY